MAFWGSSQISGRIGSNLGLGVDLEGHPPDTEYALIWVPCSITLIKL